MGIRRVIKPDTRPQPAFVPYDHVTNAPGTNNCKFEALVSGVREYHHGEWWYGLDTDFGSHWYAESSLAKVVQ
jgi:hypothetical protein